MLRNALVGDAKAIQKLVNRYASLGELLPLSINEVYEKILEFNIWAEQRSITGCCAMHPVWEDLSEIRSLAVYEEHRGKGIGRKLVENSIIKAKKMGFKRVFTLTYKTDFFSYLGFTVIEKEALPKKIWADCLKCIKFPECDEIALILDL